MPLTWALKEVDPVGRLHRQSGIHAQVEILHYFRSGMYTASATNSKLLYITQSPNPPNTNLHRSHDEIVKLDKKRTDSAIVTVTEHHVIKSKHHLTQWFSTFFSPWTTFTLNFFWWTPITIWWKTLFYVLLINKFRCVYAKMCVCRCRCVFIGIIN